MYFVLFAAFEFFRRVRATFDFEAFSQSVFFVFEERGGRFVSSADAFYRG